MCPKELIWCKGGENMSVICCNLEGGGGGRKYWWWGYILTLLTNVHASIPIDS